MEPEIGSDTEALWQDMFDLVSKRHLPGSVMAMLRSCEPTSLDSGVLYVETHSRTVKNRLSKNLGVINECLTEAAFEPTTLDIAFVQDPDAAPLAPNSAVTPEEARRWIAPSPQTASPTPAPAPASQPRNPEDAWLDENATREAAGHERRAANPLVGDISEMDSKLTFDRFVVGDENTFAYQAALQVANGENRTYNPLFIYGKSGLGKTHLLRAIQNYISANDPTRVCVYKDGSSFITDYTTAMSHRERSAPDMPARPLLRHRCPYHRRHSEARRQGRHHRLLLRRLQPPHQRGQANRAGGRPLALTAGRRGGIRRACDKSLGLGLLYVNPGAELRTQAAPHHHLLQAHARGRDRGARRACHHGHHLRG
jgi:hypothetical protein